MKRAVATVIATAVLLAAACAPAPSQAAPPATLAIAYQSPPDSLDPFRHRTARAAALFEQALGMPLLTIDPGSGAPMPWLAVAPPRVSDGMASWTIRAEARWDDGSPVTSTDFVRTFAECERLEGSLGRIAVAVSGTTEVEATDERTFVQSFTHPLAVERFGRGFVVLPADASSGPRGFDAPPACGPYRVQSRESGRLVLERKPSWWGDHVDGLSEAFPFPRVIHRYLADETAALALMSRGEISLMGLSARATAPRGTETATFHLPGFSYIGWNHDRPPFDDHDVRRALTATIPRALVNRTFLEGGARIIDDPLDVFDPQKDFTAFDPQAAARGLDRSGILDRDGDGLREIDGRPLGLDVLAPDGDLPWVEAVVAPWKETLDQLGIRLTITRLNVAGLLARIREGDFDAFMLVWRVDETTPSFRGMLHSDEIGGRNFQRSRDPRLDAAIEKLESGDPVVRALGRRDFGSVIRETRPITTLFQHPSRVCWRGDVVKPSIGARGLFFPFCRPAGARGQ